MGNLVPQGDLNAYEAMILDATSNAILTEITAPGEIDRNGDPGAWTSLWSGEARGFLARERHDVISGGAQMPVRMDTFTMFAATAPVLEQAGPDWEATRVTILDGRQDPPVEVVFAVTGMELDANGLLDSVLLTLDEVGV